METKRDFYKMVSERRKNVLEKESNCVGTALYLAGEAEEDIFKFTWEGKDLFLSELNESPSLEVGYLVAWISKKEGLDHLAIVVNKEPPKVATRNGGGNPFYSKENFEKVDHKYKRDDTSIKFYIPSKLQKILNSEVKN